MYDPALFVAALTRAPFGLGEASKAARAVQILKAADAYDPAMDRRWLAYCFATAFWESEWTLAPIREIGEGRGKPYGVIHPITRQIYYGRGLVQTTWYANYLKLSKLLKIDCVYHPDLLLQMEYAAPALFAALAEGLYTGKKLGDFFNAHREDPVNARECVNGHDKAEAIAVLYATIRSALEHSKMAA